MEKQSITQFRGIDERISFAYGNNFSYASDMKNCTIKDGYIQTIKNPKKETIAQSTSGTVGGMAKGYIGSTGYHLFTAGTKVWKYNGNGTATQLYDGLTTGQLVDFKVFANNFIICNGANTPLDYDGTTCAAISYTDPSSIFSSATPDGADIHANKFYYFDKATNKIYAPYATAAGNYNDFTNTNSDNDAFIVESGRGGNITGFKAFNADLSIIYKRNGILRLSGSQPLSSTSFVDPHTIRQVVNDIGCIAPKTLIDVGNDHYFISEKGLASLSATSQYGDIKAANLFDPIKDKINSYLVDDARVEYAFSVYDSVNGKIYCHFHDIRDYTIRFGYDIISKDVEYAEFSTKFTAAAEIDNIIWYGDNSGNLYKISENNFDSSEKYYTLHWNPTKHGLERLKRWDNLALFVETDGDLNNLYIEYAHITRDARSKITSYTEGVQAVAGTGWDVASWDVGYWTDNGSAIIRTKSLGISKAIKLRFRISGSGEHFKIKALDLFYTPGGFVKG